MTPARQEALDDLRDKIESEKAQLRAHTQAKRDTLQAIRRAVSVGVKLNDIATVVGVSDSTINKWRNNGR